MSEKEVRIDKWLWAVRIYKSRSISAEACSTGKVSIEGNQIKPAKNIKAGQIITVRQGAITRTIKVVEILERRIGAKEVLNYMEDLTPQEEYDKLKQIAEATRDRGTGRPTKKERRDIDGFFS